MLKINLFLKYQFIVIWYKPNKNEYYFKKVKGYYEKYKVGQLNSYGHQVILVISLRDVFYTMPLKTKLITKAISFLDRIK